MTLHIRLASEQDVEAVSALRIEAEDRLHTAGIDQWHNRERGLRNIREGIRAGETFVVIDEQEKAIATLTLSGPDPDWWRESDAPESALYLYKLIITDEWRGTGLGDELMDWACAQAESQGKRFVRLDCWRTNITLQKYYLKRGFQHLRTETIPDRGSGALFQRPVTTRTAESFHLAA